MVGQCENNTLAGIENLVCWYDLHTSNLLIYVLIDGIFKSFALYKFFYLQVQIFFCTDGTRTKNSVFWGHQYKSYFSVMPVQYCTGGQYTNHTCLWPGCGIFMMC